MIDSDKIIAEEFNWVFQNEPTFRVNGNKLTGKVGRSPNGESITISIEIPEFYPVIKPDVKILTPIIHPNLDDSGALSLQLLDEWGPNYRVKDIIANARRLFIKSKQSIKEKAMHIAQSSQLETEIQQIQKTINELNRSITDAKSKKLQSAGISSVQVSEKAIISAQLHAVEDLIELLEIKFEEAEIDQTDFFRLYRKYIKEMYIAQHQLKEVTNNGTTTKTETKRPIRH